LTPQKKYKLKMLTLGLCQDCGEKAVKKRYCLKHYKLQNSYIAKWKRKKRIQIKAKKYLRDKNIR